MDARLGVQKISVSYGSGRNTVHAVNEVTLDFAPQKLTLVMGPSGSGKTSLLSVLGCLLTPNQGDVTVMGNEISQWNEQRRGQLRLRSIGYVFQAFRLFHALNALENVWLNLELCGQKGSQAKAQAHAALEAVGLADKWKLKPHELSGGEKQRVAIARALVNDPPIILADEPTASLDSVAGANISATLLQLAEAQKRLVVVVSHDPRWEQFAHRKIMMRDGQIVADNEVRQ